MIIKKLAILSTVAMVGFSGAAYADGLRLNFNSDDKMISQLPKTGEVTLSGKVDSIESDKKFTIRDKSGNTIDVNSYSAVEVKEGETVTITGDLDSEFMGMGREIDNASISNAGLDLDSTPGHDVSLSTHKDAPSQDYAEDKNQSVIKALPAKGEVEFMATVEDVKSDDKVIVKDAAGKTIDVNAKGIAMGVEKGDRVKVDGRIESEALGIGRQIVAASVSKL